MRVADLRAHQDFWAPGPRTPCAGARPVSCCGPGSRSCCRRCSPSDRTSARCSRRSGPGRSGGSPRGAQASSGWTTSPTLGDGFDATYTVACLLAADTLDPGPAAGRDRRAAAARRGAGPGRRPGVPDGRRREYDDRIEGPYRAALPVRRTAAADLFALPGNHDWYDGLTSFLRVFCQGRTIGGWRTRQTRSYFASGCRSGGGSWAGHPVRQRARRPAARYFDHFLSDNLQPGDRVILCAATPTWVHSAAPNDRDAFNSLHWFDRQYIRMRAATSPADPSRPGRRSGCGSPATRPLRAVRRALARGGRVARHPRPSGRRRARAPARRAAPPDGDLRPRGCLPVRDPRPSRPAGSAPGRLPGGRGTRTRRRPSPAPTSRSGPPHLAALGGPAGGAVVAALDRRGGTRGSGRRPWGRARVPAAGAHRPARPLVGQRAHPRLGRSASPPCPPPLACACGSPSSRPCCCSSRGWWALCSRTLRTPSSAVAGLLLQLLVAEGVLIAMVAVDLSGLRSGWVVTIGAAWAAGVGWVLGQRGVRDLRDGRPVREAFGWQMSGQAVGYTTRASSACTSPPTAR